MSTLLPRFIPDSFSDMLVFHLVCPAANWQALPGCKALSGCTWLF